MKLFSLSFLVVFILLTPFVGTAQCKEQLEKKLESMGMSNIACVENDTLCLLMLEDAQWRLKGVGLRSLIEQLPTRSKPIRIIVLDNNIPAFVLSASSGNNGIAKNWTTSYRIDPWWNEIKKEKREQSSLFKFDLLFYPEIAFRNIKLEKMYDWLVNISPAIEFSAWKGMKFTGQVIFPIVNQYGEQYEQIRPGFITVSQQLRLPYTWFSKVTVGVFNQNRWGADLKAFHPFKNERFALRLQAGLTGASTFRNWEWYYSTPKRLTYSVGGHYYNPRYNVQCVVTAARYLAGDYGMRVDMMRHFRYTTIGFYGLKTNRSDYNSGFYFTIALPPYKQARKRFRVTTANYFSMEYNAGADFYYGKTYKTAPDENSSNQNFNPYFIKNEF